MRTVVVACISLILAACGRPASHAPAAPVPLPAPVAEAVRNLAAPDRIGALNAAAHEHRGDPSALVALARDPDVRVRFGAAYVAALWADDGRDAEALAPLLQDEDEATRAVVAGSLAGLGHAEARAALERLRESTAPMPFSDPPLTAGRFAAGALAAIDAAGARR
ncbi:MAG: HEAT repeat domain-containing protein [Vicinamibacterales bacterium]